MKIVAFILIAVLSLSNGFSQPVYVKGTVKDAETGKHLSEVHVYSINGMVSFSNKQGEYIVKLNKIPAQLTFSLMGYATVIKTFENAGNDTIHLHIVMRIKNVELPAVDINSGRKVDTVFGTWKYSVADFEFYNDQLLLLTFKKNMHEAALVLTDYSQKIILEKELRFEAKELTKDYLGNIILIGVDENYFIVITEKTIYLETISKDEFVAYVEPLLDRQEKNIYFSNYTRNYPAFTYFSYCSIDSIAMPIKKIVNEDYLHEYNMELYFLPPKERTYARKISEEYGMDIHVVAATISGLTGSMFYQPLYDPLFVIKDTICIFNHCNNALLKYDKNLKLTDSVFINYHHPKNWREWKNKLIVDEEKKNVYALFQKNGYYYLKQIDLRSGKLKGAFKLANQHVDNIKVKNNEVYYVYRPFESLQEYFLYKELIIN